MDKGLCRATCLVRPTNCSVLVCSPLSVKNVRRGGWAPRGDQRCACAVGRRVRCRHLSIERSFEAWLLSIDRWCRSMRQAATKPEAIQFQGQHYRPYYIRICQFSLVTLGYKTSKTWNKEMTCEKGMKAIERGAETRRKSAYHARDVDVVRGPPWAVVHLGLEFRSGLSLEWVPEVYRPVLRVRLLCGGV